MANNYCKSESINKLVNTLTAGIAEYILEVGMEEAVKKLVNDGVLLDKFPHVTAYAKEHGFM